MFSSSDEEEGSVQETQEQNGELAEEAAPPPPVGKKIEIVKKTIVTMHMMHGDLNEAVNQDATVYFLRTKEKAIPIPTSRTHADEIVPSYLSFGFLNSRPLPILEQVMLNLYSPLLATYSLQKPKDTSKDDKKSKGKGEDKPGPMRSVVRDEFLINMSKFCTHISRTIQQVEGEVRLDIPEIVIDDIQAAAGNMEIVTTLEGAVESWEKAIAVCLEQQLKKTPVGNGPLAEIDFWRERSSALSAVCEQLELPLVKNMLEVLKVAEVSVLSSFEHNRIELNKFYTEAKDNVRFLSTLERHFKNLAHGSTFSVVIDTIPSLMNALRMVWIISRHYNRDERMVPLMERIAWEISEHVARVINIRAILREAPESIKQRTGEAITTLKTWKNSYLDVRAKIEASGRDARWEFDRRRLFEKTDYMSAICQDLYNIAQVMEEFYNIFGPELKAVTGEPERIEEVLQRVDGLIEPFEQVKFDIWNIKNQTQWRQVMNWFNQEVLLIESEAKHFIDDSFKTLRSAEGAFDMILNFRHIRSREAINSQMMKKFNEILTQFMKEVDLMDNMFKDGINNPPIYKNQPPVAGAIAWSRSLFFRNKRTVLRFVFK